MKKERLYLGCIPSLCSGLGCYGLHLFSAILFCFWVTITHAFSLKWCLSYLLRLLKTIVLSLFFLFSIQNLLKAQNPNLSYIHYLLNSKKSPYSSLKDEAKLLAAYQKLKKYETPQPQTPIDSLCKEIGLCKGKQDTEKLRKYLAYTNDEDLIKCFEKNFYIHFIEGGSDDCCTYEDRYEFQPLWIQNWSLETILIIQSIIYKEGFVDSYELGYFIEVILVDKDILQH